MNPDTYFLAGFLCFAVARTHRDLFWVGLGTGCILIAIVKMVFHA